MKIISEINGSGLYAQSALSASTASYDSLGNEITATYATKSEIPSLDGLMETDKLEIAGNKITAYNGTAFAGQGGTGSTYTTDDTEYLNIDNTDSKINFTDKTKQAIDNVPTGTNYDLVGGENIKFTVDDTEHQIVIDVEAPLSTYQIFDYGTASAQQTIDCWKEGKIPVLRIPGYSALLWPCRLPTVDPTTLTTAQYQYFGCNYNASAFTAYLYSTNSRSSGLFTACNQSTYTSYTANANKWLSAVSSQSDNWNTVSSLSANKEDKITFGYNDGKIVSMNGSALSAGSNYEGSGPITVNNETKVIGARTREVGMTTFTHDNTLSHTEVDGVYTLSVVGGGTSEISTVSPITGNGTTTNPIGADTVDVNYQEITHDDSLVHTSNDAQYALGVNTKMFPCDETVLWEGKATSGSFPITLSETINNFKNVAIDFGYTADNIVQQYNKNTFVPTNSFTLQTTHFNSTNSTMFQDFMVLSSTDGKVFSCVTSFYNQVGASGTSNQLSTGITKIVGIGRK